MNKTSIALITGANRGIGLEVAKALAKRSFHVLMAVRNPQKSEEILPLHPELQENATIIECDVSDPGSIRYAAKQISSLVSRIDVLINNAAIFDKEDSSIQRIGAELILDTFKTNTVGPILITQAFLPLLLQSPEARIINVSSGAGALNQMLHWAPAYSISKTALNAVTRQFAFALQPKGIAVNSVDPGWVKTEMGGAQAPRNVEQGAETIIWLATEAPIDITGKFIHDKKVIDW